MLVVAGGGVSLAEQEQQAEPTCEVTVWDADPVRE